MAIVSDAVTGPLIGSISDRFKSKYGRRHPFLFLSPIPLALSIFLIFNPPEPIVGSQGLMFAWFVTFSILMRTFQTFFAVLHLAMGAELSDDYFERTRIMSFNALFGLYGSVFMHVVAMVIIFGLFFEDQGGHLYQPAYTSVVLVCCALVIVTILACAWGTRDQIEKLKRHEVDEPASARVLLRDILAVLAICYLAFSFCR